ncbi:hypothetical protein DQT32_04200 [Salmonella enterica subsp. enterica serovar Braenderup]|nr:hypothetical protein [Salmonella enterica subsp. enterica serovar Braenderup]
MSTILFILTLFTTIGGLVFVYALAKDMYYDFKSNPKGKEQHRNTFLMWENSFIAVWIATVLDFILLMFGVKTSHVFVLQAIHAGVFVWYFIELYKRYKFTKSVVFKGNKD